MPVPESWSPDATSASVSRRSLTRRSTTCAAVIALVVVASSCSDPDRTAGNFCAELATQLPALSGPLVEPSDIDDLVRRYERLDDIAPLAIEADWRALTELMRAAADVDVDNPDSRQEVADLAYRTERPARDVAIWVETTCGLTMPDVIGVEGSVPVSIPPQTTAAPTTGSPATGSPTTAAP